jgi:inorganic pyrophosphatase
LFNEYQDWSRVPSHVLREVGHFFATYKRLEDVAVETQGWYSAADGAGEVGASAERYQRNRAQVALQAF